MSVQTIKVELEVRPVEGNTNFFFVLDDPVQGILQETDILFSYDYPLGGNILTDITQYVKSVSITRGKQRETDTFAPGLANIVLNNNNRFFDPLYTESPFFGNVVPRRVLRVSRETGFGGLAVLYLGVIGDWSLSYTITGDSTASASCADALANFATQSLLGGTQTQELSSVRVDKVLDELEWPVFIPFNYADQSDRIVFDGSQVLGADEVEEGANALQYLQLIERSEPGKFYIDAAGRPTFLGRNSGRARSGIVYSDAGDGIAYSDIQVEYGSEYLFNQTTISSIITSGTATAFDDASQQTYGLSSLVRTDLLMADNDSITDMAVALTAKYSEPEFRFSALTLISEEPAITNPDLNELVTIKFTPNGIGDPIERTAEVIGISFDITPSVCVTTLNFETVSTTSWTLSDSIFGRLSAGNTLAY